MAGTRNWLLGIVACSAIWVGLGEVSSAWAETTYTTNYVWDANRRLVMVIQPPDGATSALTRPAVRYVYDADGQLVTVEIGRTSSSTGSDFSAIKRTAFAYDGVGNNTRATVYDGVTSAILQLAQTSYDAVHRPVCNAVRMNTATFGAPPSDACVLGATGSQGPDRIVKIEYDLAGQTLKTIQAYGTSLQEDYATSTYSDNGRPVTVKDARGNRTTVEYDDYDRPVKLRYPVSTAGADTSSTTDYEVYGYDANNNKVSVRKRDGVTITYTFDALNRQILKDMPGTADDVYSRMDLKSHPVFDRVGGLTGDGVDYGYDSAGRQTSVTAYGRTIGYQYDVAGDRTRVIWQDGFYIQYNYDALNRVTTIGENGATSGAGLLGTYAYDDLTRPKTLTLGNGVVTTYGYDGASRLKDLAQDASGTTRDQTFSFSYNPASQATLSSGSNAVYDWAPPSVQTNKTYNGLNQDSTVTALGGYDAKGNLTNDGVRAFAYDPENRLLTASGAGLSLTLSYDPLGRLRRTVSSGTTTEFGYDGTSLIAEYDGTGALLRRYVHGPGADQPLVWYEGSGTGDKRYLVTDRQGSVIGQADGSGAVTQVYTYGSYGEPGAEGWGGSRFRYTGQTVISEAQLYYYKTRFYDPIAGRFLQTDPIGTKDDLNLYAYVGGDPLNGGDPSGTYKCNTTRNPALCKRFKDEVALLQEAANDPWTDPIERLGITLALLHLGTENDGRGPEIMFGKTSTGAPAETSWQDNTITMDYNQIDHDLFKFYGPRADMSFLRRMEGAGIIVHEATHYSDFMEGVYNDEKLPCNGGYSMCPSRGYYRALEFDAYMVQRSFYLHEGFKSKMFPMDLQALIHHSRTEGDKECGSNCVWGGYLPD